MDSIEHGAVVLSGILPARMDLLEVALRRLRAEHFQDKTQQMLFRLLERHLSATGTVLPAKRLADVLRNKPESTALLYTEAYALFAQTPTTDDDFKWSVEQMIDLAAEKATGEAIAQSMTILRTGIPGEHEDDDPIKGHSAAREHLQASLAEIERDVTMQEAPEGDLRDEGGDIMEEYLARKKAHADGTSRGIEFGIPPIDQITGGAQPGEVVLLAGYSNDGKSTLAVQLAWNAAVMQGKNVAFMTTETIRPQIIRKLMSRHSRLEMFGLSGGLNARDLKSGTLSEAEEAKYGEVIADFTSNPAYGRIYITQVPRAATITSIEQRLYRIQRDMHIDLVVVDYLALLASDRKRQTQREELAAIMKDAKQVATTFDGGRGVPLVSPWQVTRQARENAEKIGMYSSASLSETAEATNSADLIVSLLAPTDNTNRHAEVTMQILKARDSATANGIVVSVDYATSAFQARMGLGTVAPASSTTFAGGTSLDDLF